MNANNTLQVSPVPAAGGAGGVPTKWLWSAIGVLGVAVVALGGTMAVQSSRQNAQPAATVAQADPAKDPTATRYERLSYDDVIQRNLQVMDTSAIALCRDHRIPLRIYDMSREGDLMRIMRGEAIGTLVGGR